MRYNDYGRKFLDMNGDCFSWVVMLAREMGFRECRNPLGRFAGLSL